jgi:hypothetical protein
MALNEQMQEAIQADIADTRSKKERIDEQMGVLKTAGKTAVENIPGVGEAILAKDIAGDVSEGNYASAALGAAALGVGFLPAGDILNKPIKAAAKKLRKQDAEVANKMLKDVDSIDTWKKQNPNPKPQKQNPDIEKAANDLLENKITGKQYRSVVKENMPIVKIEEVPEVPSFTEIVGALDKDKSSKGILGLNKTVKDGTRVASRLDIPAYERFDKWVVSVHDAFDKKGRESLNGDIMGYGKTAILKNVEFKGMSQGAANISAKKNPKGTIARIFGDYYNAEPENVAEYAAQAMKDENWTQVGYNPFRHGFFYDKDTGMPVKSAEEVIQVGPLVLAKNAQKIKISEAKQVSPKGGIKIRAGKPIEGLQNLKETKTVFNEGGVVMDKQMEMFDDGGLMQEGGTVDPESGNEVPVGSTQEEVRDDIPAKLSEGEFVFPADVVRYIGLENLMRMRQEAKMGLSQMEAMGQMGNSEEATMPDDLPFDMYDLEVDDDGTQEFAQGGVVQAAQGMFVPASVQQQQQYGLAGYQPSVFAGYQPQQPTQPITSFQPQTPVGAYTPPTQQYTPTSQPTGIPTFTGLTGLASPSPGGYDELKTYVNDAGMEIQIPFKDGNPIYPIPEGYSLKGDAVQTTQTTTTTGVGTGTAQVGFSSGDDETPTPKYTTTDPTGIGYDRAKVKSSALKDILGQSAISQVSDLTKGAAGRIAEKFGFMPSSMSASSVLGGILDDFRGGAVSYGTGRKVGDYSNLTNLESLTEEQGDIIADVFKSVTSKMSDMYTSFDEFGDKVSLNADEINDRITKRANELGIDTKVSGTNLNKRRQTLEREIAKKLAEDEKIEKEKKEQQESAAKETGTEKRAAQKAAAAEASNYGISATKSDGTKKTAGELRGFTSSGGRGFGAGSRDTGSYDEAGMFNKGGLAKQMEKSGLTPKK